MEFRGKPDKKKFLKIKTKSFKLALKKRKIKGFNFLLEKKIAKKAIPANVTLVL